VFQPGHNSANKPASTSAKALRLAQARISDGGFEWQTSSPAESYADAAFLNRAIIDSRTHVLNRNDGRGTEDDNDKKRKCS
jgi:hypothetical protein